MRLLLGLTSNNLDAVCVDLYALLELEVHVLDYERPDLVAEAVGVQMTL